MSEKTLLQPPAPKVPRLPPTIASVPTSSPIVHFQRVIGNAATLRMLKANSLIQRQEAPVCEDVEDGTCDPLAEPAAVPRVDMGARRGGRAFQLDWDSHHREIDGLMGNQTLRQAFEIHLFEQLIRFLPDEFTQTTSYDEARAHIEDLIEQASLANDTAEAERLQRQWNIATQFAVVETLNVEQSDRYQPVEGGPTYCNIYAYDVITALGGYLPRVWWNDDVIDRIRQGEVVEPIYGETVHEMNANALTDWFRTFGPDFGWQPAADMNAAQDAANGGQLVIIVAANENRRRSGHITIVMPETEGTQAIREGGYSEIGEDGQPVEHPGDVTIPVQSQAGRNNMEYGTTARDWWNRGHEGGGAYIYGGERRSPLLTPEQPTHEGAVEGRLPGRRR